MILRIAGAGLGVLAVTLFAYAVVVFSHAAFAVGPAVVENSMGPACISRDFDYGTYCPEIDGFDGMVRAASAEYGTPSEVIVAQILRESSCNPAALGDKGRAYGLGQVHPRWWRKKLRAEGLIESDEDLFDPRKAIMSIAFIDSYLLVKAKGSLHGAVRRYNGNGKKARAYAGHVMSTAGEIRETQERDEVTCE